MESLKLCRFCNIVDNKFKYSEIDKPFRSNQAYFAIASIGALLDGWALIVPKEHCLSMRSHFNKSSFMEFADEIVSLLVRKYGNLIAFEHGASVEGSITSCGTDHAHLHLVPIKQSLKADLLKTGLKWNLTSANEIEKNVGNDEYLFYTELGIKKNWKNPEGYLHILEKPTSQFFRHMIAKRIGTTKKTNYLKFPYLKTALDTRRKLVDTI